jgi:hypothetical protein
MRIALFAIALVCGLATSPVFAADERPTTESVEKADNGQAAVADKHSDKNRKICRTEVATGSVMPKRVCRTVAEIEALQAQAATTKDSLRH